MKDKQKPTSNIDKNSDTNIIIKKIDLGISGAYKPENQNTKHFIELNPKLSKFSTDENNTQPKIKTTSQKINIQNNDLKEIKIKKIKINEFSDEPVLNNVTSSKDVLITTITYKKPEKSVIAPTPITPAPSPKEPEVVKVELPIKKEAIAPKPELKEIITPVVALKEPEVIKVEVPIQKEVIAPIVKKEPEVIVSKPKEIIAPKPQKLIETYVDKELPMILPKKLSISLSTTPTPKKEKEIEPTIVSTIPKIKVVDAIVPEIKEDINKLLLELDKKTKALMNDDTIIETFSFLGDTPKISSITYKTYNIKHLYAKIDELSKQTGVNIDTIPYKSTPVSKSRRIDYSTPTTGTSSSGIMEELNIPDIIAIKDNVRDIDSLVQDSFSSSNEFKSMNNEDIRIPSFVDTPKGPKLNKVVEDNANRITQNVNKRNLKDEKSNNFKSYNPPTTKIKEPVIEPVVNQEKTILKIVTSPQSTIQPTPSLQDSKQETKLIIPLSSNSKSNIKEIYLDKDSIKSIDYIMPVDANTKTNTEFVGQDTINSKPHAFRSDSSKMPALVYSSPINVNQIDIKKTYEKYSLDDFTYVTISYIPEKGLFYNLVQPELTLEQEKTFSEIKKIFFNTIDQNFYTFKGDKYNLDLYTQKIFDISISKLSIPVSSLDKKLYYKFIQREFSGLGILSALLSDKKILEVSCAGEKTSITVYHINYGTLETNINFDSLQKLNQFVMILTKNMGLYVNSAHPIIDGYLPNGYKVEGLYSVGELSSRGSSFIIRKYLDEPITPIALINNGVGAIDVYAYIWSAIAQDYKIIFTGDNDSFMLLNSIALLYPDKKIISVQSYDRLKLPQKEWIKRILTNNTDVDKKTIIQHTISERPDYIIVDDFSKDIFEVPWYSVNMFYINLELISQLKEQIKLMSQKAIIINLRRIKTEITENIQIIKIDEFNDKSEFTVVEMVQSENSYHMNLLSSSIDIVDFNKKKKYIRWLKDAKINDYRDFNNIINEFSINEDKVVKRLGIDVSN